MLERHHCKDKHHSQGKFSPTGIHGLTCARASSESPETPERLPRLQIDPRESSGSGETPEVPERLLRFQRGFRGSREASEASDRLQRIQRFQRDSRRTPETRVVPERFQERPQRLQRGSAGSFCKLIEHLMQDQVRPSTDHTSSKNLSAVCVN